MPSIPELEKLLAAEPADTFALYALAQAHAKAGDHARALEFYDRCLAVDPEYCYAYFHKARVLEQMGRADAVAQTLRDGVAAARRAGDGHALSEITGYLDSIEP